MSNFSCMMIFLHTLQPFDESFLCDLHNLQAFVFGGDDGFAGLTAAAVDDDLAAVFDGAGETVDALDVLPELSVISSPLSLLGVNDGGGLAFCWSVVVEMTPGRSALVSVEDDGV